MRNWNWPRIAKIVTLVYCGMCLISGLALKIGYYYRIRPIADIGVTLLVMYFANPMGAVTSIIAACKTRKGKYLWYLAACTVCWFLAFGVALTTIVPDV